MNLSMCVRMCVCCTGPGFSFCQADCVCCGLLLQHQCANSRISLIFQPPWTSGGFGHTIPLPHELKHTHTHTQSERERERERGEQERGRERERKREREKERRGWGEHTRC